MNGIILHPQISEMDSSFFRFGQVSYRKRGTYIIYFIFQDNKFIPKCRIDSSIFTLDKSIICESVD